MQYREMKKLGIKVSTFGIGCMRFPMIEKDGKRIVDESISTPVIRKAIDSGVNYVDTAYVYSGGQNEVALGHALKDGYREKVYVASKLPGHAWDSKEHMRQILDETLDRLGLDYLDFYLVHGCGKDGYIRAKQNGILEFMEEAKAAGKIKYICFSFHDNYDAFEYIIQDYHWDMCQVQFNFMDVNNQASLKGVELAGKLGIPVVVMEGLLGGSLAHAPEEVQALYDAYPVKRSPAEWAFRWIANRPEVAVILSGVTDMAQTEDNLRIFDELTPGCMNDDELKLIDDVRQAYYSRRKNGCTGCRYCMPCPAGVDIPGIFGTWNHDYSFGRELKGAWGYRRRINDGHAADQCVECHSCEEKCPQHLNIVEDLKLADADMRA